MHVAKAISSIFYTTYKNNASSIHIREEQAFKSGYGPLTPCMFVTPPCEQKTLCCE